VEDPGGACCCCRTSWLCGQVGFALCADTWGFVGALRGLQVRMQDTPATRLLKPVVPLVKPCALLPAAACRCLRLPGAICGRV
jgi:hypothetical protein